MMVSAPLQASNDVLNAAYITLKLGDGLLLFLSVRSDVDLAWYDVNSRFLPLYHELSHSCAEFLLENVDTAGSCRISNQSSKY
jgi:hypothetical protein